MKDRPFDPYTIGPTWDQDANGKFIIPKLSLGYEALRWTYKYLKGADQRPWRYTAEQARLTLWWYALKDDGTFLYRDSVIQRVKGWGKDPMIATWAAFELCGPCRFDFWDEDGMPVGKQPSEPWIQVAAVSREQTKNTMKLFPALFTTRAKSDYQLKIGRELIHAQDGIGRIEAVTSAPATLEGGRPSWLVLNETHWWTKSTDGPEMAIVGRENAGKVGGRVTAITNAPQPGQESVAEVDRRMYEEVMAGKSADPGTMYDTLEAPQWAGTGDDELEQWLEVVRGDSVWKNMDDTVARMRDKRVPLARSRRLHYNQIVAAEDALIAPGEWDLCADPELMLLPGEEVTLGLDGGYTDDATALCAIRIRDKSIFSLGIWQPEDGEETNMDVVDGAVAAAFAKYKVRAFFSDVHPIQAYVNKWSDDYRSTLLIKASPARSAVGYDMRSNHKEIIVNNEALIGAIREQQVHHNGDLGLREHVLNAYQFETALGMSFRKESRESRRKVDAYAAALLAFIAMNKYLESGKKPAPERTGKYWFL